MNLIHKLTDVMATSSEIGWALPGVPCDQSLLWLIISQGKYSLQYEVLVLSTEKEAKIS